MSCIGWSQCCFASGQVDAVWSAFSLPQLKQVPAKAALTRVPFPEKVGVPLPLDLSGKERNDLPFPF